MPTVVTFTTQVELTSRIWWRQTEDHIPAEFGIPTRDQRITVAKIEMFKRVKTSIETFHMKLFEIMSNMSLTDCEGFYELNGRVFHQTEDRGGTRTFS